MDRKEIFCGAQQMFFGELQAVVDTMTQQLPDKMDFAAALSGAMAGVFDLQAVICAALPDEVANLAIEGFTKRLAEARAMRQEFNAGLATGQANATGTPQ